MNKDFYAMARSKEGVSYIVAEGNTRLDTEIAGAEYARANGMKLEGVYKTVNARTENRSRTVKGFSREVE